MKSQIAGSVIACAAALGISTSALLVHQYKHKPPTEIRVVDGDTLEVDGTDYRLSGINTPELKSACKNGNKIEVDGGSKKALESLTSGARVARTPLRDKKAIYASIPPEWSLGVGPGE